MKKKLTLFGIVALFLVIRSVAADVLVPFFEVEDLIFFSPLIIIIELFGFWLFANKFFSIKIGFWKSLLIVAVANVVTSLIGTFIFYYQIIPYSTYFIYHIYYFIDNIYEILITFVLSVIVEFVIFLLFFNYFIKKDVKKINIFWISVIINVMSYLVLYLLSLITVGNSVPSPF